jgi:hypothetical protein
MAGPTGVALTNVGGAPGVAGALGVCPALAFVVRAAAISPMLLFARNSRLDFAIVLLQMSLQGNHTTAVLQGLLSRRKRPTAFGGVARIPW